jgi:hypothetical protein
VEPAIMISLIKEDRDFEDSDVELRSKTILTREYFIEKNKKRCFGVEAVSAKLNLPRYYVNLIYCNLESRGCLEYGTSLQYAWLTKLGEEMIDPELGPEFSKFIKEKMEWKDEPI